MLPKTYYDAFDSNAQQHYACRKYGHQSALIGENVFSENISEANTVTYSLAGIQGGIRTSLNGLLFSALTTL